VLGALDGGAAQRVGVLGLVDQLVADRHGDFQGERGEGGQQQCGDGGVDDGAGHVLADRGGVLDAVVLADVAGHGRAVVPAVVAHGHAAAAPAADDQALEQGGAFPGRAGLAVVAVRGGVGGQCLLVDLVLRPGQVAGMVVVDHDGPLVGRFGQGVGAPVQVGGVAGPPVDVGAGVGGVVQDVQDLVVAQAVPVQLAGVGAAAVAAGEEQLLVTEGLDHGERRTGGSEGSGQQRQGAADARVGVQGYLVAQVVDQPDRQLQFQFPAAGLGQYPAAEPGSQEMEFEFLCRPRRYADPDEGIGGLDGETGR